MKSASAVFEVIIPKLLNSPTHILGEMAHASASTRWGESRQNNFIMQVCGDSGQINLVLKTRVSACVRIKKKRPPPDGIKPIRSNDRQKNLRTPRRPQREHSRGKWRNLYIATDKTWKCQICMAAVEKYGRLQITSRINSKHRSKTQNRQMRKCHHSLINDTDAISRETDFGANIILYRTLMGEMGNRALKTRNANAPKCGEIYAPGE